MRRLLLVLVLLPALACAPARSQRAGSGDDTDETGETADGGTEAGDAGTEPERLPFACPSGQSITEGLNTNFMAGGRARTFHLELPQTPATTPVAVVFSWHGVGDSIDNWRRYTQASPSADPEFPFAIVTPGSLRLQPPAGLDWDMFNGGPQNLEGALVEAVLGCLQELRAVDARRIHSVGFSGGAIVTNLLHSQYPNVFASTVALSGAWFNDPAQKALVDPTGQAKNFGLVPSIEWPAMDAAVRNTVLLSRGGTNDAYGAFGVPILNFNDTTLAAVPFLRDNGRDSIVCEHANGHQPHPQLTIAMVIDFLRRHPRGTVGGGLPAGWPQSCTYTASAP